MKPVIKWVLGLILFAGIAFGAYQLAMGITDSIYAFRSPLSESPPKAGPPLGEPMARKLVFVLIDALRYDTSLKAEVMPTLNELRSRGAYARMTSQTPSYSAPGYSVLLTGAWPYLSDGPAFNLAYDEIPSFTQDNLFAAAKQNGLNTAVSGYYWFEKLIPADVVDAGFFTPGEDNSADREVMNAALPWIRDGNYQLILIHIDQVDYAGHHEGGPASLNWDAAARRADAMLAEILAELDLEQDVIFVCSDHGQINAGGHGGQDPVTLVEPFVLAGKGVLPGAYDDVDMVDVAPTLAVILGANLPASSQGSVLVEMLVGLSPTVQNALPQAVLEQQQGLLSAYQTAMNISSTVQISDVQQSVVLTQQVIQNQRAQRLRQDQIWRLIPAVILIAALLLILIKTTQPGDRWLLLSAVGYTVLFHFFYFVVRGKVYSYSAVVSETELIILNGGTALLLLGLIWFVTARRLKWFAEPKPVLITRSFRLFLFVILVTCIPVLVHFVWNGLFVGWTLPALGVHYVALLSLIQILFLAVGAFLVSAGLMVFVRNQRWEQVS